MRIPDADHSSSLVLVGSSLGPESDEVVGSGLAMARHETSRLALVHVLEPQGDVASGLLAFSMVRDGLLTAAREQLAAQLRRLGALSRDVAEIAVELPPADAALLAAAERWHPRLLVIGANRDCPPSLRLGSVATRLLRRSPCPLWLVKGRATATPTTYVLDNAERGERERLVSLVRKAECPVLILPTWAEAVSAPPASRGEIP
ncbi:MAG TPA: universal stress protein [Thermoanaerobaculia bacterium]|jgi:nucleotide-binding universal stress UspA family protein|nr:universal stress protein [Thermoanaerobaculia bacterium]